MISLILGAVSNFILLIIEKTGYFGVAVLMTLESAGIPIPSEIVMPFSGYLVSGGRFSIWLVAFFATLGNVIGSLILYFIGCYGGRKFVVKYGRFFLMSENEVNLADEWFKKYGSFTIFFSRLAPIARTYISLPAGMARMNLPKFIFYTFFGSAPWNLALAVIGFVLGKNWETLGTYFHKFDYLTHLKFLSSSLLLYLAGLTA